MEIPSLDELISKFQAAGLTHLEIKNGEDKIVLKKRSNHFSDCFSYE